ncbi:MAG: ribosome small subunit-dependent GTPase A [Clostridia bacterium]|nr:ribosome small subunit-dependent GTPase A [Clostridia bacterium]
MNGTEKTGIIIKGVGGFYTVLAPDGTECVCKARGLFRKQQITPIVGDRVDYMEGGAAGQDREADEDGARGGSNAPGGYLLRILPRKNELIRPAVANIDRLVIVVAASRPVPDLLLVDKLLILCEKFGIEPLIAINKCDEADENAVEELTREYAPAGYGLFPVSAETGEGLSALKARLDGAVICFAGQSAVGKSSLLNALLPGLGLAVGGLSRKTERGRHTTRHTELIPLPGGGAVLDTPGFSLLDSLELPPEEIRELYPELRAAEENCRFSGCMHVTEPGCSVKKGMIFTGRPPQSVLDGETKGIHKNRYERYVRLVGEAEEHRRHRYD